MLNIIKYNSLTAEFDLHCVSMNTNFLLDFEVIPEIETKQSLFRWQVRKWSYTFFWQAIRNSLLWCCEASVFFIKNIILSLSHPFLELPHWTWERCGPASSHSQHLRCFVVPPCIIQKPRYTQWNQAETRVKYNCKVKPSTSDPYKKNRTHVDIVFNQEYQEFNFLKPRCSAYTK